MKVNANLKAMSNIATTQQVAADNVANVLTSGFQAKRALQSGDSITISQATRDAILKNEAATATDMTREMIQMRQNEAALSANITAIKTQNAMYKAMDSLKK